MFSLNKNYIRLFKVIFLFTVLFSSCTDKLNTGKNETAIKIFTNSGKKFNISLSQKQLRGYAWHISPSYSVNIINELNEYELKDKKVFEFIALKKGKTDLVFEYKSLNNKHLKPIEIVFYIIYVK